MDMAAILSAVVKLSRKAKDNASAPNKQSLRSVIVNRSSFAQTVRECKNVNQVTVQIAISIRRFQTIDRVLIFTFALMCPLDYGLAWLHAVGNLVKFVIVFLLSKVWKVVNVFIWLHYITF